MRIAWFRPADTDAANPLDATATLIDELRRTDDIDVIVEARAHDFVWQQLQRPWDLCVFELDNTHAHQFIWGYLPNYPGVALLSSIDVANLRVAALASRAGLAELHARSQPQCRDLGRERRARLDDAALRGRLP